MRDRPSGGARPARALGCAPGRRWPHPLGPSTRACVVAALLLGGVLGGCAREATPPGGPVQVPDDLRIPVEIADGPDRVVDAALLRRTPPDLRWGKGAAWSLLRLLGDVVRRPAVAVEAFGPGETSIVFHDVGAAESGPVPALVVNARGQVLAMRIDLDDPLAAHHGRGGARGRGGTQQTRLRGVRRLRVFVETTSREAADRTARVQVQPGRGGQRGRLGRRRAAADGNRPAPRPLQVQVPGRPPVQWTPATLRAIPQMKLRGPGPVGRQQAWDLRQVLFALLGPERRLGRVVSASGNVETIGEARWNDLGRVPTLRVNRRGMWRFQWTDDTGKPLPEPGVRDVVALEVVSESSGEAPAGGSRPARRGGGADRRSIEPTAGTRE